MNDEVDVLAGWNTSTREFMDKPGDVLQQYHFSDVLFSLH